jgi:hypothetical protein
VNLSNVTITDNTAGAGGAGGGIFEGSSNFTVNVKNTIVAGNLDAGGDGDVHPDCSKPDGTIVSFGYNLIGDETGCDGIFTATGDQAGTSGSPIDARPGPLADNGGPTLTHALCSGVGQPHASCTGVSPALDGVGADACEDLDGDAVGADQRGFSRPQGPMCDVGAYETTCGDGLLDGNEECDTGDLSDTTDCCDDQCQLLGAETVCRAATDLCDAPETCAGQSDGLCPADGVLPAGTPCRTGRRLRPGGGVRRGEQDVPGRRPLPGHRRRGERPHRRSARTGGGRRRGRPGALSARRCARPAVAPCRGRARLAAALRRAVRRSDLFRAPPLRAEEGAERGIRLCASPFSREPALERTVPFPLRVPHGPLGKKRFVGAVSGGRGCGWAAKRTPKERGDTITMRIRRIDSRLAVVAASLLACAGTAWAATQTNEQQKCINKMNKDAIKLQATQGKEQIACVKSETKNEATDVDFCKTQDPRGKVLKRQMKTTADDNKFCGGLGAPEFGYAGDAVINSAARDAELDLFADLFGDPADGNLYPCNPNVAECNCQRNVIDRVEKFMATMGRVWVKCKKNALKVGKDPFPAGADSEDDLDVCVEDAGTPGSVANDVLNPAGKLAERSQNILDAITLQNCNGAPLDPFGGPECNRTALGGGPTDAQLRDCLQDRTECRFCLMVEIIDNLTLDCDLFDDGAANGSCP